MKIRQSTSMALATFGPSTKQAELQSFQSYTKREYVNCLAKSIKKNGPVIVVGNQTTSNSLLHCNAAQFIG